MSNGSSGPRLTKTGKYSNGISFGQMNESLKSLAQIGVSICGEELMKDLKLPISHRCKAWRRFSYCLGGFCQLPNRGFAPGEG